MNNNNVNFVRNIVSDILNSNALRENLEATLQRQLQASLPGPGSVPSDLPTTSNGIRDSPITTPAGRGHLREEICRLFPTFKSRKRQKTSAGSGSTSSPAVESVIFYKEVFIVKANMFTTYKHGTKSAAYETGYALSEVAFDKNWSEDQIKTQIRSEFPILIEVDFEFVRPIGGRLVKIDSYINGASLKRIFLQKAVYVKIKEANHTTPNMSEADGEDITNEESNIQPTTTEGYVDQNPSNNCNEIQDIGPVTSLVTLQDILNNLRMNISEANTTQFNVFRGDMLQCCMRTINRKSFNPSSKISVKFSDIEGVSEGALDAGGPMREMFRLVLNEIKDSQLFVGTKGKYISLNMTLFDKNYYHGAGVLIALSLIHGGPGPHFFSEIFYEALIEGVEKCSGSIDFLDADIRYKIEHLQGLNDLNSINSYLCDDELCHVAGIYNIKNMEEKESIINSMVKFYSVQRTIWALEQFKKGLNTCNVMEAINSYPNLFRKIMCDEKEAITATSFMDIFEVVYSESGSTRRIVENRIISYFRDVLQDIEDEETEITLNDLLVFCTGADTIPPLGFPWKAKLLFLHDTSPYPTANTCGLQLSLPCVYETFSSFKEHMLFAVANCNDFALA